MNNYILELDGEIEIQPRYGGRTIKVKNVHSRLCLMYMDRLIPIDKVYELIDEDRWRDSPKTPPNYNKPH